MTHRRTTRQRHVVLRMMVAEREQAHEAETADLRHGGTILRIGGRHR